MLCLSNFFCAVRLLRLSAAHPAGLHCARLDYRESPKKSIGTASVLQTASCTKLADTETASGRRNAAQFIKICRSDDGCAGWAAIGAAR